MNKNHLGLLSALRKYRPRENSDPLENFVTEAFAWLLNSDPAFSCFFLDSLPCNQMEQHLRDAEITWETQVNWDGKSPDMVAFMEGGKGYVFEHKVWSDLHGNQLQNYRDAAEKHLSDNGYKLILITAHRGQHSQNPDGALCWEDVYRTIQNYLQKPDPSDTGLRFIFEDFLQLLTDIGLAPLGSFKREEIIGYSSNFHHRMNDLWAYVAAKLEKLLQDEAESKSPQNISEFPDFRIEKDPEQWGRIGLSLFREWRPGLFAGVLLDPTDHGTGYSASEEGPDVCLILSLDQSLHSCIESEEYRNLNSSLENAFPNGETGWKFYDHLGDKDSKKNCWHPIHIRRPLIELLTETGGSQVSIREQAGPIADSIADPIRKIIQNEKFLEFRNSDLVENSFKPNPKQICHRWVEQLKNEDDILSATVCGDGSRHTLCVKTSATNENGEIYGLRVYFDQEPPDVYFFTVPGLPAAEVHQRIQKAFEGHHFDTSGDHPKLKLEGDENDPSIQTLVKQLTKI